MTVMKKEMGINFWDHQDAVLFDSLTRGATVNATSYCATLDRLRKALSRKLLRLLAKGVLYLHDNTSRYTVSVTRDLVQRFR